MSEIVTVNLNDVTQLCPSRLLQGDREFDGNGPNVTAEVELVKGSDNRSLWVKLRLHAKETKPDWSETEGRWNIKVWEAPSGKQIKRILSDRWSETKFRSPKAGFQLLGPTEDFEELIRPILEIFKDEYPEEGETAESVIRAIPAQGNTVVRMPSGRGNLVKFFHIVGDTGGPDISKDSNPKDDTRFEKIEFNPVRVEIE